jgi:hypothetical protein
MSVFDLNSFEVGNPMTLGLIEESLVEDIGKLADKSRAGYNVYARDVQRLLDSYGIRYSTLAQWIKNEIDKIDLSD